MPIANQRDDQRWLITVTVTDPCSVDDISSVIDRQAAEDTWEYAAALRSAGSDGCVNRSRPPATSRASEGRRRRTRARPSGRRDPRPACMIPAGTDVHEIDQGVRHRRSVADRGAD